MRLKELTETASAAATTAGAMATLALPIGEVVRRQQPRLPAKYQNSAPSPGTEKNTHARRRS